MVSRYHLATFDCPDWALSSPELTVFNPKFWKNLILKLWSSKLNNVGDIELDPKTALQHWVQEKKGRLPNYTDMKREGSDHDPIFYVEVKLENGLSAIGKDKSKRKAQQNAAQKVLSKIKNW